MGVLVLEIIDYDEIGVVIFFGCVEIGMLVCIFVNGVLVGEIVVGGDGCWMLQVGVLLVLGIYDLQIDQVILEGLVLAVIVLLFECVVFEDFDFGFDSVVVQLGNFFWCLVCCLYGQGVQYMVIYEVNCDQICDFNLIYLG